MNTAQRRRVHPKYAITRAGAAVCLLAAAVTRAFGQGVVAALAMPCKACHEALFNAFAQTAHFKTSAEASAQSRSEEHTSELQSQSNLVCRLLLEKKKLLIIYLERPPRRPFRAQSHLRSKTGFLALCTVSNTVPDRGYWTLCHSHGM